MKVFILLLAVVSALVAVSDAHRYCQRGKGGMIGHRYRGHVSRTKSGLTCQKWNVQKPHKHTRTPKKYKGKGLGNHNYCRNPDKSKKASSAWCYTTNPKKRWENCRIPRCGGGRIRCQKGKGAMRGHRYRGKISSTKSGFQCQKWTSQKPHKHTRTPKKYKGKGLGNHNHCRNPDKSKLASSAWCYTTNPKKRWENCAVPSCRG